MTESLWPTSPTIQSPNNDDGAPGIVTAITVLFAVSGFITHVRYMATTTVSGTYSGIVWEITSPEGSSGTGTELAFKVGTTPTPGVWNDIELDDPVPVVPGVLYKIGVHSSAGRYVSTSDYFSSGPGASGVTNGNITAPASNTDPIDTGLIRQNTYSVNSDAHTYPVSHFLASNYWVDMVFTTDSATEVTGAASLSGQSDLTTLSAVTTYGLAALSIQSTLTVTAITTKFGAAVLTGQSSLIVVATKIGHAAVVLTGQSNLSVIATNITTGVSTLSGQSTLTVTATVSTTPPSAVLSGQSTLVVIGRVTQNASATITGQSTMDVVGRNIAGGAVTLTGQSSIAVIGTRVVNASAVLSGQATLDVVGNVAEIITGSVVLSGQSDMTVNGSATPPWTLLFIEFEEITVSGNIETLQTVLNTYEIKTQATIREGG